MACRHDQPPLLEPDVPWMGVVVHGVHGDTLRNNWENGHGFWEALKEEGVTRDRVKEVWKMCMEEVFQTKDRLLFCLMFSDFEMAHQLIHQGMFVYGSHCRVSAYRPCHKKRAPVLFLQLT